MDKKKLLEETPLLKEIIDRNISLEVCPKSNVQTYGVHWYKNHPAVFLSRLGVNISVSTDNRTISNSDVTNEFVKLYKHMGATYDDIKKMVLNGFESAFIFNPYQKVALLKEVNEHFDELERDPRFRVAIYKTRHKGQSPPILKFLWMTLTAQVRRFWHDLVAFYQQWYAGFKEKRHPQAAS